MSLPVDPIMLLSVVNLKLRDQYKAVSYTHLTLPTTSRV